MKYIAILLTLLASPVLAAQRAPIYPPPCAVQTLAVKSASTNVKLSSCGRRIFILNSAGNLTFTTMSLNKYAVMPGAGRMATLGPNDTIVALQTDGPISNVMVEQCAAEACAWKKP
jgi:hypothetical protein